jgi:glucokinase
MKLLLGLDFGGTKLAAGLVDPAGGAVLKRTQCATPHNAVASMAAMLAMARELTGGGVPRAVGVSFGGPVAADNRTVRLSMHIPGWEQAPLAEWLETEFGVPCAVANDADAAALAEYRFGAGRGVRHMLYLTVSTGIGGGVIVEGRLHRGERAWAGEVGHMVLDPDGPPCPCGRNGCLEALASGLSIARDARIHAPHLNPSDPGAISARDVVAALDHDPAARKVWERAMRWLGVGIASAANLLNPGLVVLGGGLTNAGALLFDPVQRELSRRALDPETRIVRAQLGDDVGILGGAALVMEN